LAHIAAGSTFITAEIHPQALAALGLSAKQYSLASLRYDLSKLRVKGLVEKLPRSRRYRLSSQGYSICLLFLKLFERIYCPFTAGLLRPFKPDSKLHPQKKSRRRSRKAPLCRRPQSRMTTQCNENKIPVKLRITV
jgi:hypothetical protein